MNAADWAIGIAAAAVVILAALALVLIAWAIHRGYQWTWNMRIAKQNPPAPPKSPSGTAPPNVTEISKKEAA